MHQLGLGARLETLPVTIPVLVCSGRGGEGRGGEGRGGEGRGGEGRGGEERRGEERRGEERRGEERRGEERSGEERRGEERRGEERRGEERRGEGRGGEGTLQLTLTSIYHQASPPSGKQEGLTHLVLSLRHWQVGRRGRRRRIASGYCLHHCRLPPPRGRMDLPRGGGTDDVTIGYGFRGRSSVMDTVLFRRVVRRRRLGVCRDLLLLRSVHATASGVSVARGRLCLVQVLGSRGCLGRNLCLLLSSLVRIVIVGGVVRLLSAAFFC